MPADGKPIGAGLLLDLGKPYALRALQIATPTPGFSVELYGAVDAKELPEDILDKRWEHLTDIKKVVDGKVVSLLKQVRRASTSCCCSRSRRPPSRPTRASRSATSTVAGTP